MIVCTDSMTKLSGCRLSAAAGRKIENELQFCMSFTRHLCTTTDHIASLQIIEPHIGESGEVIASIPVKVSVRAVHSKYTIYSVSDINFGAALVNTKKTQTFTIENKGEFVFWYTIMKMVSGFGRQKHVWPGTKRERSGSNRLQQPTQQHQRSVSLVVGAKPRRADSVKG